MIKRILLLLALAPSIGFCDCNVETVLLQIRPGAQWSISNHDPSTLIWISTDSVQPTLSEIQAGIANCPTQVNIDQRGTAITDLLSGSDDKNKLTRAILLTIFDENNTLREWIQAFKGQVALATSLADLKTRVAALPDTPDRTTLQAKTAVQNKINSGAAD